MLGFGLLMGFFNLLFFLYFLSTDISVVIIWSTTLLRNNQFTITHVTQQWGFVSSWVFCLVNFLFYFENSNSPVVSGLPSLPRVSPVLCLPWSLIVSTCSPLAFCVFKSVCPFILCQSILSVVHPGLLSLFIVCCLLIFSVQLRLVV